MPNWIVNILIAVLLKASPEIKGTICEKLNDLEVKAKETKNPWDNVVVGLLKTVLACPD